MTTKTITLTLTDEQYNDLTKALVFCSRPGKYGTQAWFYDAIEKVNKLLGVLHEQCPISPCPEVQREAFEEKITKDKINRMFGICGRNHEV